MPMVVLYLIVLFFSTNTFAGQGSVIIANRNAYSDSNIEKDLLLNVKKNEIKDKTIVYYDKRIQVEKSLPLAGSDSTIQPLNNSICSSLTK